jgi:hypothetical protein
VDHHRLGGIVHIPEHPVALGMEGASHDHPGHVCLGRAILSSRAPPPGRPRHR